MPLFIILLLLSALSIAGVAAYISVRGIGLLFAGFQLAAMIMAGSLEVGKILSASFLYRYWDKTNLFLRIYLVSAILMLMIITSLGIYGFLTMAYSASASQYGIYSQQISLIETQKKFFQDEIDRNTKRIEVLNTARDGQEKRLDESNTTLMSTNRTISVSQIKRVQDSTTVLIKEANSDIKEAQKQISSSAEKIKELNLKVIELKTTSQHSKDIITFEFLARSVGTDIDTVVKWFTLFICVVFDPLSLAMILAYNICVYGTVKRKIKKMFEEEPIEKKTSIVENEVMPIVTSPMPIPDKKDPSKKKDEDFFVQPKVIVEKQKTMEPQMLSQPTCQAVPPSVPVVAPGSIVVNEEPVVETLIKSADILNNMPANDLSTKSPEEIYNNQLQQEKIRIMSKNYFKLTDDERRKLTYDELQKMQDADRNKLHSSEYYHVATTPTG